MKEKTYQIFTHPSSQSYSPYCSPLRILPNQSINNTCLYSAKISLSTLIHCDFLFITGYTNAYSTLFEFIMLCS